MAEGDAGSGEESEQEVAAVPGGTKAFLGDVPPGVEAAVLGRLGNDLRPVDLDAQFMAL